VEVETKTGQEVAVAPTVMAVAVEKRNTCTVMMVVVVMVVMVVVMMVVVEKSIEFHNRLNLYQ
jgi:hypothetical protein